MPAPALQPGQQAPRRKTPANQTQSSFSDEALLLTDAPVPGRVETAAPRRAPEELAPRQEDAHLWVESFASRRELEALAADWQALADDAAEPNPFYEPWMVLPALDHFGAGVEVLAAFAPHPSNAKGKRLLCGIFPISQRRGRVESWRYPYCYLSAPILRKGFERRALGAFFDALASRAQVARLEDVPGDGPVRRHLIDELNERGWPCVVSACYTRAVLKRGANAEDYLSNAVQGKRRKEWR